jgi:shikimate kinase
MGVGKSVVGKILANKLGFKFVDIDQLIVEKTNKPISKIFSEEGEAAFREIEKEVTHEIALRDNQVIACGGGTILDDNNLNILGRNSTLILLTADPEIILKRVKTDGSRPLLNVENKTGQIERLLKNRYPRYIRAADLIVDTSKSTPADVADDILSVIQGEGLIDN